MPGRTLLSWRYRWLLWSFTRRELLNRYVGSVAGAAWAIVHPLALLAVYAFIFTMVFKVRLPEAAGGASYVAFVAVTLWPWLMFADGLQRGMSAVRANEGLIRKVAFPNRLVVYSAVASTFLVHLAGFATVLAVLAAIGQPIHASGLVVALALVAMLALATLGLAALLAALQVVLRDVEQVFSVALTVLFYATPILYPLSLVPEPLRSWAAGNPLATFAERMREALLAGSGFAPADAALLLGAILTFVAGLWVFERLAPYFEDFL
ncbi:ABC transporter permease [Usitatibacter palustris]|uniref:Transport permease protein n=1 Tax=Usitatibacter palustris TaxID=2732487 RepID=A0A6M4HEN1_9PROT|nr:ABC transporter permease [Usitatibacter palustris]QJR16467.1 hypothetical protein DSM104440_03302 [Usitatibacter palustris]